MTAPELANPTDYGRMYSRKRGGELLVPSITTVIGQHATDMSGWHGYMAAKAALEDQRAYHAAGSSKLKYAIIRDAAVASQLPAVISGVGPTVLIFSCSCEEVAAA